MREQLLRRVVAAKHDRLVEVLAQPLAQVRVDAILRHVIIQSIDVLLELLPLRRVGEDGAERTNGACPLDAGEEHQQQPDELLRGIRWHDVAVCGARCRSDPSL